tara:strand:+ start:14153 stop:15511 length:1359 start_codon:yes stop_codon:yes gene_type:complete
MKSPDLLSPEQQAAITHIYENDCTYLIGQMGSGKSVTALTAAAELLGDKAVQRVLVVAPLRVANDVWKREHTGWAHLNHLTVGIASGTALQRAHAIETSTDIAVITFDNLPWFFERYGAAHGFDMLIVDEVTKLKAGGVGFKKMRKHLKTFKTRVVMTGTPVAEAWTDLFYCMFACDGGERLGRNRASFLTRYCYPLDYEQRKWAVRRECINELTALISDVVVVLPDYTSELPPLNEQIIEVDLSADAREYYDAMEQDCVTADVTADNAAVLTGKLQQLASGFVYTDDGDTVQLDAGKMRAARELGLAEYRRTARGVIYVYQYKEELRQLKAALPSGRQLGVSQAADMETLALWRSGALTALFLHPKSAGHGLDLTAGASMVITSPIWSRDLMRQVIARIWRRNQTLACSVFILCARNTVDGDIVARESGKGSHMDILMARLNAIRHAKKRA